MSALAIIAVTLFGLLLLVGLFSAATSLGNIATQLTWANAREEQERHEREELSKQLSK